MYIKTEGEVENLDKEFNKYGCTKCLAYQIGNSSC